MSERYKLGLTRNRLFEFDNCVLFCGKTENGFDVEELEKALKMLCIKEPLITSKTELQNDGTAFAVTESVDLKILEKTLSHREVLDEYEKNGICFWERMFEFSLSADGFLIIAAHTALCDAKSLLQIACELYSFYKKDSVCIEPSAVKLISGFGDLPVEVASPVTDKLSAELDSNWKRKSETYSVDSYKTARNAYMKNRSPRGEVCADIDEMLLSKLKTYCRENSVDVSSAVAFAVLGNLLKTLGGKKNFNKMNLYADERFFFENFEDCGVGAYNGVVTVGFSKKYQKKPVSERLKQFHLDCYKGVTSAFKVFYDETLLMKVSPSLCDSAYMYKAGLTDIAVSGKLAEHYGCACERICDFFACNLEQDYWKTLDGFEVVDVFEPLKMRSATYVNFIRRKDKAQLVLKYKKDKCADSEAQNILKGTIRFLEETAKINI